MDALQPKIAYHLHRHGLGADPLAIGHARILSGKAVTSFNPESGASFNTWLDRSLMPLTRFRRLRATAVKMPEKLQLESLKVTQARRDFEDTYDREPELDELAEHAGMSVKRMDKIARATRKMSGEAAFEGNLPDAAGPDYLSEALEAVWDEADAVDRKILEMKAGFGGKHQPMAPKDVAIALNLSPVALSRRSARLGAKIDELLEQMESP